MDSKLVELKDVCDIQRGLTYSGKDTVDESEIIVIRATNIDLDTGNLIFDELKYLRNDFDANPKYSLNKGSILICFSSGSKSHLGKVALVDDDYDGFYFGGFIGQLRPKQNILSKYLYYCLRSESYKNYISKLTDGLNINNLKTNDLKKFKLPLPSKEEQSKIVKRLDLILTDLNSASDLIQNKLLTIENLKASVLENTLNFND